MAGAQIALDAVQRMAEDELARTYSPSGLTYTEEPDEDPYEGYTAPRVYFWKPERHWYGWRTLWPVWTGEDPDGVRTLLLGWTVTGRAVVRLWECKDPECVDERNGEQHG
jgi:hypothetical protein